MNIDLATALKAIALVGDLAPAVERLYAGFIASTQGADQEELRRRYAAARREADTIHDELNDRFPAQ